MFHMELCSTKKKEERKMKNICKQCSQKEIGCTELCADRRIQIAERKERSRKILAAIIGAPREPKEASAWK